MRNLKRVLGLALAMVMVLSMMVIGAGAANYDDFSDKDEIVNTEAVSVLVELGVIAGKDDGSYDPTGIVTRAEMAKMICVVLNGGKDPALGNVTNYSYADTVGHWAAAYIEYCSNLGIVAGDGTGNFNPNATVTGSEAAKMLLVAAGYQAAIEGFTGANWAVATNVRANQVGLYEDLDINPSEGLSRDNAAQMVYNALSANVVTYKYTLVSDGSTINSIPELEDKNVTVLEDKFGAIKVEGVVVANEYAKLNANYATQALDEGETEIAVDDDLDIVYNGDATFKVSTGADMLGRSVSLFVKPSASNPSNASKATVIGSVIVNDSNTVVVNTADDKLDDILDDNNLDDGGATVSNVAATDATTGIERIIIDNDDDGEVDYVIYNTYYFGQVTKYSTKDDGSITVKTIAGNKAYDDAADVVGFDDVEKDDYVIAIEVGGKLYVEKAESVVGELTAYKTNASLTVDGTKYTVGINAASIDSDEFKAPGTYGANATLDKEATFYLDKFGYVVAVGSVEGAADDFAFLWGVEEQGFNSGYEVKVTLSDGTTGVYVLTDKDGSLGADTVDDDDANQLYTYSINSDDEITLTAITGAKISDNKDSKGDFSFTKGKMAIRGASRLNGNADTVFFNVSYKDGGDTIKDVDVYTGISGAPSLEAEDIRSIMVATSNTSSTAAAVVTFGASTSANGEYLYLYGYQGTNSDGAYYRGIVDGVLMNDKDGNPFIYTDENDTTLSGVYEYTLTADGLYQIKDRPANMATGVITAKVGNGIMVNGVEYTLSDSTVIATIDGGDTSVGDSLSTDDVVTLVYDESGDDRDVTGAFILAAETELADEVLGDVADAVKEIEDYDFESAITVKGNTVTLSQADATDETRNFYMNDVARFLGELYHTGEVTEIKFDGETYKWADPATLKGSNWTVDGAPVVSEPAASRNTLVYAIFGSTETTPKNPTSIALTVDGVAMVINLVN